MVIAAQLNRERQQASKEQEAQRKAKRDKRKASLQKEVQELLKQGQSHKSIAGILNTQHRRNASGRRVDWTERMIVGLDPDLNAADRKRELAAIRQRNRRYPDMTKREQKAIENDAVREYIRNLHDEGNGYAAIARILNEGGLATRTGRGLWNKSMVKRELVAVRVLKGTQNVTLSGNQEHY